MSTHYFILTKPNGSKTDDNTHNQIHSMNPAEVHLLPRTNLIYYTEHGLFECRLMEWCKQFCQKDKVFLDIGAHSGTYSISLSSYVNHVYSFEPQKMTYYALCGSVALSGKDNITCLQYGLGSKSQVGEQTLKIVSNDGGGSSLHATSGILREEQIQLKTLDSFELKDIGFIKMDVEENELYVLQGAVQTLEQNNYPRILFESNFENQPLFEFIKGLGYTVIPVRGYKNMYLATHLKS